MWYRLSGYVCSITAFPVEHPSKGVHYMPLGFRGQWPLRGLWLLTCHITNIILIFIAAGRKIWAWKMWMEDCHEDGRGFSSSSCARIHYGFSYVILRQQTSQFHMQNLSMLHVEVKCSTTTTSNSKLSAEGNRISARYIGGNVSFPTLRPLLSCLLVIP